MTEQDPLERGREMRRWRNYHPMLKIADRRTNQLVPFAPNVIQQRISDYIDAETLAERPIRVIVLKARRMGVSTIVQMRMAHRAFTTLRFTGITGAHEARSSTFLHGMVEQAYDHLPHAWRREKRTSLQGRELAFVEGSGLQTFTAGSGEGAARGTGYQGLHASEVAFWENAAGVLVALRQIIPDEAGTMVFLESTAKGLRNEFRDEWVRAVEGRSGYEAMFFAWHEFPDYTLDLERLAPDRATMIGYADGVLAPEFWRDYEEGAEDEEEVLRGLGLMDGQLAWRRFTIAGACKGSIDLFHQEYPATPEEAFLSSGRPFIAPSLQTKLARMVVPARGVGDLTGQPIRGGVIDLARKRFGPLHVFEPPNGDPHIIGADTAGGITEEEEAARERKEGDYCTYVVVNLKTGRTVAEFQKRTDADVFATDLARAGWAYQTADHLPAEIAVESNNMGLLTLSKLRDELRYPRIYHRESLSHEHRGARTKTIGWQTSSGNRGSMLAQLLAIVRDHPYFLPSRRLLDQIRTFVWVTDKRVEHEVGAHDDIVFATAIAYQLFLMRSYYPGEVAQPAVTPSTVAELEALLRRPEPPRSRIREQVLLQRPRR